MLHRKGGPGCGFGKDQIRYVEVHGQGEDSTTHRQLTSADYIRFRASKYPISGKLSPSVCRTVLCFVVLTRISQNSTTLDLAELYALLLSAHIPHQYLPALSQSDTPSPFSPTTILLDPPSSIPNPGSAQYTKLTYLPILLNALESDGGMAIVPFFHHSSNIPTIFVSASETYVDNQTSSGYFDCHVDSHGSLYPDYPECLYALHLLIGVDT